MRILHSEANLFSYWGKMQLIHQGCYIIRVVLKQFLQTETMIPEKDHTGSQGSLAQY